MARAGGGRDVGAPGLEERREGEEGRGRGEGGGWERGGREVGRVGR